MPIIENINDKLRNTNPATEETLQSIAGFSIPKYDYIECTYPTTTTEVYTYKDGGSGGVTVGTITVTYATTVKDFISSILKS